MTIYKQDAPGGGIEVWMFPGDYRALGGPSLSLEFARTPYLDPRVTFTRASSATYFDSTGLLATAANDAPRFDYDPVTLRCSGLLIEEQRTNLLLHSRDMTQAAWSKTDVTAARTQVGIDGTTNSACLMTEGSAGTAQAFQTGSAITAGSTITGSFVLKRGNTDWVRITVRDSTGTDGGSFWFNLNTGVKGTTANSGAGTLSASTITALGGGWYRCTATTLPNGTYTQGLMSILSASADASPTRVPNATYIVDAAQLEVGAFATSIIITGAATVTRAADSAVMTGTNFSSWYNQTQGTFVVEFDNVDGGDAAVFSSEDSGAANRIGVQISTANQWQGMTTVATVANYTPNSALTYTDGSTAKGAFAWDGAGKGISFNGAAAVTNATVPPLSGLDRMFVGRESWGNALNGHIRRLTFYPTRLPNATLQALSAA